MPRAILHLSMLLFLACAMPLQARTLDARIARITTPVATMQGVEVRLVWPDGAASGQLHLRAARIDMADLGYRFRDLAWQCPLSRDTQGGWHCAGALRAGTGAPLRLDLDLATATTDVVLARGASVLALHRDATTPDDTRLDLTRIPLAWMQALSSQAWTAGRLQRGTLDGRLTVLTPTRGPLRVDGALALRDGALDTPDATIAVDKLGGSFRVDYRKFAQRTLLAVDGELRGGELLFGSTYVALPSTPVQVRVDAMQSGAEGWHLPTVAWTDGDALQATGSIALKPDAGIDDVAIEVHSRDLSALPARYLSGWLGTAGLAGMTMQGAFDASLAMVQGDLSAIDARLGDITVRDAANRFAFEGLDGTMKFSAGAAVDSELRWRAGALNGIPFNAATLPWRSADGSLAMRGNVAIPVLGGNVRFTALTLQPPSGDAGMRVQAGLEIAGLELGKLSTSLGGPAFRGTLDGTIPLARYADDRIDFDGGLSMQVFDGRIDVSSLALERPFGTAPSLSADFALHDLDLLAITETFDVGSISGRLEGRIDGLRLVDWSPTAFDAELHTERRRGVRQRISQRAVQSISSVGDASFVGSLQGRLIGLFDDFGYARIGIACRLSNEVCAMSGLRSADNTFTIVEGSGVPRLQVVGFNRSVDWPTLLERLEAVGRGDVKPVVE